MNRYEMYHTVYDISQDDMEVLRVGNRYLMTVVGTYLRPYNGMIRVRTDDGYRWCKVLLMYHFMEGDEKRTRIEFVDVSPTG